MKSVIFSLLFGVVLWAGSAGANDGAPKETAYERVMRTGVLKCGYYAWPPYFIKDANSGEMSGLAVDYAQAVGDLLDLKIEFVEMAAIGLQAEELKKGLYDAYCLDSYYVFTSIKFLDFGDPFFFAPVFVYVRSDDARFKSLNGFDATGVKLVGIDGDISVDLARRRFPKAETTTLPANSDAAQIMMNVANGKADGAIIDPGVVQEFNKTNPPGLKPVPVHQAVAVYPISFSVTKGEGELLKVLDGAVSALYNTGITAQIVAKYNLPPDTIYLPAKPYTTE